MAIVCSGSVAIDYLMRFPGYFKDHILPDHLDTISLSFLVDEMDRRYGGIAANICFTLGMLGQRAMLFATVGEDFESYRTWLVNHKVDCTFARVIPGKFTASFFENTDLAHSQIASFYTGAMANSADIKISELPLSDVQLFMISPSDPNAMIGYAEQCKQAGIPYGFDPSQQIVRMDRSMIREGVDGAQFLFCNEYEFELLKKHGEYDEIDITEKVEYLIITLAEKGSRIIHKGVETLIPVYPVENPEDPTGVGDAFRAGFLTGFYNDFSIEVCGRMGSLAASYVLEQRGTQSHQFTIPEFIERYRRLWDDKGVLDTLLA
jgi:adenosine kinase